MFWPEGKFIRRIAAAKMILKGILLVLLAFGFYFILDKKIIGMPFPKPSATSSEIGQADPPSSNGGTSSTPGNNPLQDNDPPSSTTANDPPAPSADPGPSDPLGDIAKSITNIVNQVPAAGYSFHWFTPPSVTAESSTSSPALSIITKSSVDAATVVPAPKLLPEKKVPVENEMVFKYNLRPGYTDAYVKILQRYLNKWGFIVARRSYGSPGQETTYYGNGTQGALIKLQQAHADKLLIPFGYKKATGHLAGATKDFVNSLAAQNPELAVVFDHDLRPGRVDTDVKILQQYLNLWGFLVAKSGSGSPGRENTYFGETTQNALIKFQEAHADKLLIPFGYKKATGHLAGATKDYVNELVAATIFDK